MDETIYQQAINKFGVDKQMDMLIEEMAELTQAILKVRRKPGDLVIKGNLYEEYADVTIMMRQLQTLLNDNAIGDTIDYKLNRLQTLINEEITI